MLKFSVLMSIYYKEDPIFFDESMDSIWTNQSVRPNEIVLVKDGFLTPELDASIQRWRISIPVLRVISLDCNVGLGKALKIGLDACSYDLIARMDSDDISKPDRFDVQVQYMSTHPDCDIIGSAVSEFNGDPGNIVSYRYTPEDHKDIVRRSATKNPFNHPTVMYRKASVFRAGNYMDFEGFEDYYLWVRMIQNGSNCANITKPLVNMRGGPSMLSRRGGVAYAINEVRLQYKFLNMGFTSPLLFLRNILVRIPIRLLPNSMRSFAYMVDRRARL